MRQERATGEDPCQGRHAGAYPSRPYGRKAHGREVADGDPWLQAGVQQELALLAGEGEGDGRGWKP